METKDFVLGFAAGKAQGGGGEPTIEPLSITANGTYTVPSGVDGYSPVTVNVPSGGGGAIVTPSFQGLAYCYVSADGTKFYSNMDKTQYLNIFEVQSGHIYLLAVGEKVGTRRRASFFEGKSISDFTPYLETQPSSQSLIFSDGMWLAPFTPGTDDNGNALYGRIYFECPANGIICYGTDNASNNCPAYCIDVGAFTPESVTPVEYIEVQNSTGPYINTRVRQGLNTYFELDVQPLSNPSGFFYGSVQPPYTEIEVTSNIYSIYINNNNTGINHNMGRHVIKAFGTDLTFDGETKKNNLTWSATNALIFLFARSNLDGSVNSYAKNIRIYSLKIWNGSALFRNFIPCYRDSDNEPGLYDTVYNRFYPNVGTGSFVLGPVVN